MPACACAPMGERYQAQNIELNLGAELLMATAKGSSSDLTGLLGIDLDLSAETEHLGRVALTLGTAPRDIRREGRRESFQAALSCCA